jgi:5-methylcytosine-specific restriction endonuclease McrA
MNYSEKLRDPREHTSSSWKNLRYEKLKLQEPKYQPGRSTSDYWCEKCGLISNHVHVHHLRYASTGNRLIVPLHDLIVLCGKCHTKEHKV